MIEFPSIPQKQLVRINDTIWVRTSSVYVPKTSRVCSAEVGNVRVFSHTIPSTRQTAGFSIEVDSVRQWVAVRDGTSNGQLSSAVLAVCVAENTEFELESVWVTANILRVILAKPKTGGAGGNAIITGKGMPYVER